MSQPQRPCWPERHGVGLKHRLAIELGLGSEIDIGNSSQVKNLTQQLAVRPKYYYQMERQQKDCKFVEPFLYIYIYISWIFERARCKSMKTIFQSYYYIVA